MESDYIKNYANESGAEIVFKPVHNAFPGIVSFFAFITSFNDSMTSTWNEEAVYGRPDPIGTFQNTTRKISLAFDVPARNFKEASKNLVKINNIKQFMYPTYSSNVLPASDSTPEVTTNALSLSKNPLMRIKFANLMQNLAGAAPDGSDDGLLGWINSFSATPVIEMGMFNKNGKFYPKVYNVSLDFTPQHEFDLGFGPDGRPIDPKFFKFPYEPESK